MSLFACSLNSGSNGNCYYIGTSDDAILIDAGLSCRETEKRMREKELEIKKVRAIFISHEHSDHIRGIERLSDKYNLPVYVTEQTCSTGCLNIRPALKVHFNEQEPVQISALKIQAFRKFHDAADPHSFVVSFRNINVGIFTDLGRVCQQLIRHFKTCHAAFLECNYDEGLLENGRYPVHLKNRIRGGSGHLSNKEALNLFLKHRHRQLSHLFLSHLSHENNSPELVERLFSFHALNTKIVVASRYKATDVYEIKAKHAKEPIDAVPLRKHVQLNLF